MNNTILTSDEAFEIDSAILYLYGKLLEVSVKLTDEEDNRILKARNLLVPLEERKCDTLT